MASTFNRSKSPVINMATILPNGKRVTRSLHTRSAKQSDHIGEATQKLIDTLSTPEKARQTVLRVLVEDIFLAAKVPNPWEKAKETTDKLLFDYSTDYVTRKAPRISPDSVKFIQATLTAFASYFGRPVHLAAVTGSDCQGWYDRVSGQVVAATANNRFACVSAMFSQAVKIGLLRANPCAGVQLNEADESTREALSDPEICTLCNHLESKGERGQSWITAIHLARYAGLRLQDAASLRLENIVNAGDGIALFFTARKTDSTVTVPCVPELARRLAYAMAQTRGPRSFLCPEIAERSSASLSTEFAALMDAAGVDAGGRIVNGRTKRTKGFHGLRHAFCSDLARRNVPEDLRRLMAGHSSAKVHAGYCHQTAADMAERLKAFSKGGEM